MKEWEQEEHVTVILKAQNHLSESHTARNLVNILPSELRFAWDNNCI